MMTRLLVQVSAETESPLPGSPIFQILKASPKEMQCESC